MISVVVGNSAVMWRVSRAAPERETSTKNHKKKMPVRVYLLVTGMSSRCLHHKSAMPNGGTMMSIIHRNHFESIGVFSL